MEIKTCEQYVLAELAAARAEGDALRERIAELEREASEAEARKAESPATRKLRPRSAKNSGSERTFAQFCRPTSPFLPRKDCQRTAQTGRISATRSGATANSASSSMFI